MKKYNKAVVNGRFEIPHVAHLEMIRIAKSVAEKVYIVIGSASAFPNIMNPFRPAERIAMLKAAIKDYGMDYHEFEFVPVDDNNYRNARWEADIRDAVNEIRSDKITMVGYHKDKNSWWLETFGWELTNVPEQKVNGWTISSNDIRHAYFSGADVRALHHDSLTPSTMDWLDNFKIKNPIEYARLHTEHAYNQKELNKFKAYPYAASLNCCTGDAVVVCNGHLLVTIRGNMPGLGAYALPGGHKDSNETFKECAIRELNEEVGLKVCERVIRGSIKETKIFDYPTRSYPICKPTLGVFIELMPDNNGKLPKIKPKDEVRDVLWMPLHMVRRNRHNFFDDHYDIISYFCGL